MGHCSRGTTNTSNTELRKAAEAKKELEEQGDYKEVMAVAEARPRQGESSSALGVVMSTTLEPREKQLREEQKSGGNQPTNISRINRR